MEKDHEPIPLNFYIGASGNALANVRFGVCFLISEEEI